MKLELDKLPEDPKFLHQLVRDLVEKLKTQEDLNLQLQHQLSLLKRGMFGRRSERFDEDQGRLGFYAKEAAQAEEPAEPEAPAEPPKKPKGHGRRKPPKHLPEHTVDVPLPEDQRVCGCCDVRLENIGTEETTQLEYKPATVVLVRFKRYKYACPKCHDTVVTSELPYQPILKGMPGPGLLAYLLTSKYADHLPLQRLKRIFARGGLHLNVATMCGWISAVVGLLAPLYAAMMISVLSSRVINTDATGIVVRNGKKKGRKKGNIWAYLGDEEHPLVVFDFTMKHSRDGPENFLKDYSGYVQADAHRVYDSLFLKDGYLEVGCMAHARRKFYNALDTDRERAQHALGEIKKLYEIEEEGRTARFTTEQMKALRMSAAAPILERFKGWLKRNALEVLPKSPIGDAIGYMENHWVALNRYLDDGILSIDNNAAERALRGVVIGRKNYMFAGNEHGAKNAAILYSFVESCKRNGVDPFEYFRDVLIRLDSHPASQIERLLPSNWKALVEETGPATLPYYETL